MAYADPEVRRAYARKWQALHGKKWYATHAVKRRLEAKRHTEKRVAWLAHYKLRVGCMDCGYREHAEVLEFDHVWGTKSFTISQQPRTSMARLRIELNKGDVVCANCHRVRTYNRRQTNVQCA